MIIADDVCAHSETDEVAAVENIESLAPKGETVVAKKVVFATHSVSLPTSLDTQNSQLVHFGTSLEFKKAGDGGTSDVEPTVVLPCIFGSAMEGPLLLATGRISKSLPFADAKALQAYYASTTSAVFIVNDKMTDNCRNVATSLRMNGVFVVQLHPTEYPEDDNAVLEMLNTANINCVTALAGPQSLVLIQIKETFYFYRGLANLAHLDTTSFTFGSDVTSIVDSVGLDALLDARVPRIVDLDADNLVFLPDRGEFVKPKPLFDTFDGLSLEELETLSRDIQAIAPQLQVMLNQTSLQALVGNLSDQLSAKVNSATEGLRAKYLDFMSKNFNTQDKELLKQKAALLGELRAGMKEARAAVEPVISCLANIISVRATSKRTHDLARLARHNKIYGNVEATKTMTFETLGGYLEEHASEMGVMLLNIDSSMYRAMLQDLKQSTISAE